MYVLYNLHVILLFCSCFGNDSWHTVHSCTCTRNNYIMLVYCTPYYNYPPHTHHSGHFLPESISLFLSSFAILMTNEILLLNHPPNKDALTITHALIISDNVIELLCFAAPRHWWGSWPPDPHNQAPGGGDQRPSASDPQTPRHSLGPPNTVQIPAPIECECAS